MTRESADAKARRYLTEGRLTVQRVDERGVKASCRGSGHTYTVGHQLGGWSCDCEARTVRCAHLLALQLVVSVPACHQATWRRSA